MGLRDDFKDALSSWATGVSVVATKEKGKLYGLTVSSFTSLSLDPPMVLVCLANSNRLPRMVLSSKRFAISILGREQEEASNYFAVSGREPTEEFTQVEGAWTPGGMPIVKGCIAWVDCSLHEAIVRGDHTIIIGEVTRAHAQEGLPLLYHSRGYHGLG